MENESTVLSNAYVKKNKLTFTWTPLVLVVFFYTTIYTERFSILGFGVDAFFDIFLFAVIMLSISYFRLEALKENREIYNLLKKIADKS